MNRVRASDYGDISQVDFPAIAPGGGAVAFVRRTPENDREYEATIFVVPVGGDEPTQFTVSEGVDAEPCWSPDGERLAFVSTRGEADDRAQLWVMPTDGGEAKQVTNVPGSVSNVAWSPDGERLVFVQTTTADERDAGIDLDTANADAVDGENDGYEREPPDPRVIDRHVYRAGKRYFEGTRSHVYLVDLDGHVERITDGEHDFISPAWGDSSTVYCAVKRGPEPDDSVTFDVEAYDLADGHRRTVTQTTGWQPMLAATADGRIAVTRVPEERMSMRQTEIDVVDAGTGEKTVLTAGLDRTVSDLQIEWDPREEFVYFCTPDEGSVVLRRVRGRVGGGSPDTHVVLGGDRHVDGFSAGQDAVAVTQSEWDHPGDVFLATPAGAEEVRLTRVNANYLDERAVREPEEIWFESDGHEIQGWMLTPPDLDPDETYPLAVEIHGGPHEMWSTTDTMWHEFQTLAAAGYVVFWSNPRGSTGYGEEHTTAIERDWGAITMTDVENGVDEIVGRDYVDEDQTFVTGGSFGGFMTGWIVGHTDRFDAAVAQRGVYDLSSFYGSTDAFKLVEGDFGTTPWAEPDFLWEQSPVAHAAEVTTPTLVMHAENDFRVPVNNGEMFYLFLKKNGVDTRLVRYPREGHELSRSGEPGHIVDRIERIRRWFDGYSTHDAPPALDRGEHEGLSKGIDDEPGDTE